MSQALREIPALGRWTLGLHAVWGAFLLFGYAWLGEAVEVARPLVITAWFGTTAMFLVFGLLVASGGWRANETRYLVVLLIFDLAPAAILLELLRTA
jgi:hypothetical protein